MSGDRHSGVTGASRAGRRARNMPERRSAGRAAELAELLDLVARGKVSAPVAKVLPYAEAAEAQALVDGGHSAGEVVLVP